MTRISEGLGSGGFWTVFMVGKELDRQRVVGLAECERAELDVLIDRLVEVTVAEAALHAERIGIFARAFDIAERQAARARVGQADMPLRSIVAELAAAVRVNDRTLQGQLDDAVRLTEFFPATITALREGKISRGHAAVVLATGARLGDAGARAGFEEVVLKRAAQESPARLRAFARRLAERVEPFTTQERFDNANSRRAVTVTDLGDGTAELRAILASALAYGIKDRLDRQAKALTRARGAAPAGEHAGSSETVSDAGEQAEHAAGDVVCDVRTMDQVRADLLADLLLTATPTIDPTTGVLPEGGLGAVRASVQVTVPVTTLTGTTRGGAELDGRAPIDPGTAKHLAGTAAGWDRIMIHPVSGTVLEVDRYQPSADQQRFLDARDVHCRWPGCRQPVRRCQVDHNHERQHGGRTNLYNLAHLCLRHHTLKTETPWTITQTPDGTLRFTSPGARDYLDTPPPHVVFTPDTEPPPF